MAEIENTDEFVVRMTERELNTFAKEIVTLMSQNKSLVRVSVACGPKSSEYLGFDRVLPQRLSISGQIKETEIQLSLEQEEWIDNKQQEGET